MFFLFYLFIIIIGLVPSIIFFLILFITKKRIFAKIGCVVFFLPFVLLALIYIYGYCFVDKMQVDKEDIYGEYIINKKKCPGNQANWQYEHYRFEIKKNNKIYFKILNDNKKIIKTIVKDIEIKEYYNSPHIDIKPKVDDLHILRKNPTLYREIWSFYYVFESEKYGNMFFKKRNGINLIR